MEAVTDLGGNDEDCVSVNAKKEKAEGPGGFPGPSAVWDVAFCQSLMTSPAARVPMARQFAKEMLLETRRTEPSIMRPLTPEGW